jgi:quercetin dioxygenase-like cupin family protein
MVVLSCRITTKKPKVQEWTFHGAIRKASRNRQKKPVKAGPIEDNRSPTPLTASSESNRSSQLAENKGGLRVFGHCGSSVQNILSTYLAYTHIADLAAQAEPPAQGILSRTVHNDEQLKAVVFGFDQGQELTEHTASKPAVLQIIRGEATLTLGDDTIEAQAGAWVHMPAELRHAVKARTPVVMLLLLLKS